jgi:hypothetical protein
MSQAGTSFHSDPSIDRIRVPPHSVEAEQSVLGGLLLENSAWDRIGDLLREDDFYRADHRLIWRTSRAWSRQRARRHRSPWPRA